jgi:hypothetical protein
MVFQYRLAGIGKPKRQKGNVSLKNQRAKELILAMLARLDELANRTLF